MCERNVRLLLLLLSCTAVLLFAIGILAAWATWGLVPDAGDPVTQWILFWGGIVGLLLATQVSLAASWYLTSGRRPERAAESHEPRAVAEQTSGVEQPPAAGLSPEVRRRVKELEAAVAERKWQRVEELFAELEGTCREEQLLERLRSLVRSEQAEHVRELTEQLEAAKQDANPQGVLDVRDRLVQLLETQERRKLDETLAAWSLAYLREALHEGRTRELIDLIERMVETFGESTPEGLELKNALPILRRSAGRCPDCGKPYDISLERCPDCEQQRRIRKKAVAANEPSEDGGGNGQQTST